MIVVWLCLTLVMPGALVLSSFNDAGLQRVFEHEHELSAKQSPGLSTPRTNSRLGESELTDLFQYKREITVENDNSHLLVDYQVNLTLEPGDFDYSKAKSDGSDIRFFDAGGNSIPYWIEAWDTAGESKIWLKVPELAAQSSATVSMYYGCEHKTTSLSRFDDVFGKAPNDNGVVGQWDFDEGGGQTVADSSGNANDGTWHGSSMSFNGVDDYVEVPDDDSLDITEEITIEAWVKLSPTGKFQAIIDKKWADGYALLISDSGNIIGYYSNGGPPNYNTIQTADNSFMWDDWTHISYTFTESSAKIYINGELKKMKTPEGGITSNPNANLRIGCNFNDNYQVNGLIDNVRIYSRALSAQEVQEHYHGVYSDESGLAVCYHFNESASDMVYDSSGNENHGQKMGSSLEFDGVDDYVDCGKDASTQFSNEISTSMWFKTESTTSQMLISKDAESSDKGWKVGINYNGKIFFAIHTVDFNGWDYAGYDFIPLIGQWYHAAFVYDGTQKSIIINGDVKFQQPVTGEVVDADELLKIGIGSGSACRWHFNGIMDNVRIYSRALSADEVAEHYHGTYADESGLVGCWHFDEGSGTTVVDHSGNGNDGTIYGGENWSAEAPAVWSDEGPGTWGTEDGGAWGGAEEPAGGDSTLRFDGKDDYVEIGHNPTLDFGPQDFTIELWVKPGLNSGIKNLIQKTQFSPETAYTIRFKNNDVVLFSSVNGTYFSSGYSSKGIVSNNRWHHILGIIDRESGMYIYVDGNMAANSTDKPRDLSNTANLKIGYNKWQDNYFSGLIDDVRIYDRALSAAEVAEHYSGVYANDTGLVGRWDFDEGSGTTAVDSSGNGNDGTLGGDGEGTDLPSWVSTQGPGFTGGSAGVFNGVDDYVDCGNDASLQLNPLSIEFWFNSKDKTNSILTKGKSRGQDDTRDWDILGDGADLKFVITDGSSSLVYVANTYPSLNEWHHLMAMWDGTTNNNGVKLYLDGNLFAQGTASGTENANTDNLYIGGKRRPYSFDGLIDNVRIYDRALSAKEVWHNYEMREYAELDPIVSVGEEVDLWNVGPVLGDGSVSPSTGNNETVFEYSVTYSDANNDAPSSVEVFVDSVGFDMSTAEPGDSDYTDGCTYVYSTTLAIGGHEYHFEADDDDKTARLPAAGELSGPTVEEGNILPVLSHGKVTPQVGTEDTSFTYTVTYTDADNDAPGEINVIIDSVPCSMEKSSPGDDDYTDGCVYKYETYLSKGYGHDYRFQASDEGGSATGDTTVHSGPLVTTPPEATLTSPENGASLEQPPILSWSGFDPQEGTDLSYCLYLGDSYDAVNARDPGTIISDNITSKNYDTAGLGLEENVTYHWTVIPHDGYLNGTCKSGIWQFIIGEAEAIPKVELLSPLDESTLYNGTVTLKWHLSNADQFTNDVTYDLYLSTSQEANALLEEGLSALFYQTDELDDDTYYWRVRPVMGETFGICLNDTWSFTVNTSAGYDISVDMSDEEIVIGVGESYSEDIEITNNADSEHEIMLECEGDLSEYVSLSPGSVSIPANGSDTITLDMDIPMDLVQGTYSFSLKAYIDDVLVYSLVRSVLVIPLIDSDGDGLYDVQEEELGTDPGKRDTDGDGFDDKEEVDQGTDPLDPDDFPTQKKETDEKEKSGSGNLWIIVVVLVIVLLLLVFFLHQKGYIGFKPEEEEPEEEFTGDIGPVGTGVQLGASGMEGLPSGGSAQVDDMKDELKVGIKKARREGRSIGNSQMYYSQGMTAYKSGDMSMASSLFESGLNELESIEKEEQQTMDLIKTQWTKIATIREDGVDTSESEEIFSRARTEVKQQNFRKAGELIELSVAKAQEARKTQKKELKSELKQEKKKDYYEVLGVPKDASKAQIKKAFAKLMQDYHPDKVASLAKDFRDLANKKAKLINEAYETLKDEESRKEYDKKI